MYHVTVVAHKITSVKIMLVYCYYYIIIDWLNSVNDWRTCFYLRFLPKNWWFVPFVENIQEGATLAPLIHVISHITMQPSFSLTSEHLPMTIFETHHKGRHSNVENCFLSLCLISSSFVTQIVSSSTYFSDTTDQENLKQITQIYKKQNKTKQKKQENTSVKYWLQYVCALSPETKDSINIHICLSRN